MEGKDLVDDMCSNAFLLDEEDQRNSVFCYSPKMCQEKETKFHIMAWVQVKKSKTKKAAKSITPSLMSLGEVIARGLPQFDADMKRMYRTVNSQVELEK